MDMLLTTEFWIAVGQIIVIDILLGGDNAVVIALACRKLPPKQRTQGIIWGTVGAIVLRVGLIFFALQLLAIPFLKLAGAVLLLWIGVKLLLPEHGEGHADISASDRMWGAVKTVIVADFVMSLDNVIAIAGAAESAGGEHSMALVVFGILVSIPIIVWGSQFVIRLMDRLPAIITLGGMLLGWIAGTMAVTDPALLDPSLMPQWPKLPADASWPRYAAGIAGAGLVLALGKALAARRGVHKAPEAAVPAAHRARPGAIRRVLLAQDGSEPAKRALEQLLAMRESLRDPSILQVELLNVQRPVSGDVASFVSAQSIDDYHRERSDAAIAPARERLTAAGQAFREHRRVGVPGPTIAQVAQELDCDLIVMGTRGLGSHTAALLGSAAQGAAEHATVPVLLVR
jgi:YjbE family integral membrane protein